MTKVAQVTVGKNRPMAGDRAGLGSNSPGHWWGSGSTMQDTYLAYRILKLLSTPFRETDAYRLKIIDADGNTLIPHNKLVTDTQKKAYSALHRLVWNLKKLLDKVPYSVHRQRYDNFWQALWLLKEEVSKQTADKRLVEKTVQRYLYEGKTMETVTLEDLKNQLLNLDEMMEVNPPFDGRDIRENFDDSVQLGESGKLYIKKNIVEYWENQEGKAPTRRVWSFATCEDASKVFNEMKTLSTPLLKESSIAATEWTGSGDSSTIAVEVKEDDEEKLAEEEGSAPANNVGDGQIAGCNQDPPRPTIRKKRLDEELAILTGDKEGTAANIRNAIVSELKAVNEYETYANSTSDTKLKKIFLDIADEEKVHIGELEELLSKIDPSHDVMVADGRSEADSKTQQD
jgi:hypothetical protein